MIFEWMGNGNKWFLTILWLVYGLLAALIVTIATEIKPKFVFFCQVRVLEEEKEIDGFPDDARGWSKIQWWNHFMSIWIDSFNLTEIPWHKFRSCFRKNKSWGKRLNKHTYLHIPNDNNTCFYPKWKSYILLTAERKVTRKFLEFIRRV